MYQSQSQGVPSPASSNATASILRGNTTAALHADSADLVFKALEIFFTTLFSCELMVNMAAFWLRPFLADPWSWFDMVRASAHTVPSHARICMPALKAGLRNQEPAAKLSITSEPVLACRHAGMPASCWPWNCMSP